MKAINLLPNPLSKKSVLKKEEMWLLNFLKENLMKEKKSQSIS